MLTRLRQAIDRYSGVLRTLKPVYVLNNWLHRDQLAHNRRLYQQVGLNKSVLAPVSAADFAPTPIEQRPWLDQPRALERMEAHPDFGSFSSDVQQSLRQFVNEGFLILRGFYDADAVRTFNQEVDQLLAEKSIDFNFTGRKIMNAHRSSEVLDQQYYRNAELLRILTFLLGRPLTPFQSITFLEGSEQKAHSDSVHMMTQPEGFLIASWTAFEATSTDNGALFYYPGSHRLPILTTQDFDSGATRFRIGSHANARYEEVVAALVEREGLQRKTFFAEPGDVLVWHANLLHGGSAISRPGSSRRSMVGHYFGKGVICYHELTQRPALMQDA